MLKMSAQEQKRELFFLAFSFLFCFSLVLELGFVSFLQERLRGFKAYELIGF